MRRHAKAPSAGSASSIGLRLRGLITVAVLATLALALSASPAFAAQTHVFEAKLGDPNQIYTVHGLAVDQSNGNIYATIYFGGEVRRLDSSGAAADFSALGTNSIGGLNFDAQGTQLAVDNSGGANDGNLYATDTGAVAIQTFADSGAPADFSASAPYISANKLTGTPGGPFSQPCGVAVDANGAIYVGDFAGQVNVYAPSGQYLTQIAAPQACKVAVDSAGNLYVNAREGAVSVFAPSSFPVTGATTYGAASTVTSVASFGVSVDPANDDLYVAHGSYVAQHDSAAAGNARLGIFGVDELGEGSVALAVDRSGGANDGDLITPLSYYGNQVYRFGPAIQVPDASIDPATGLTGSAAVLHGSVGADGGPAATCQFLYVTETAFQTNGFATAATAPCSPLGPFTGSGQQAVSANLAGLAPETAYRFRLEASSSNGTNKSLAETFTTPQAVKEVTTGAVTNQTLSTATLNGTIVPGGIELSECKFEYGTGPGYEQSVPCAESNAAIGSGEAPVSVHADIAGLTPGDYHFRLVAANSDGVTRGADVGFAMIAPPAITGFAGSLVYPEATYAEARFRARINPGNAKTTYRIEYGPTTSYGESGESRELDVSSQFKDIFTVLSPLPKGVTYHFRLVATNAAGTTNGEDLAITITPSRPADNCANAAIRAAQGSTKLAECRAYEMVSPFDKAGNDVSGEQVSADGSYVTFGAGGALPGAGAQSGVSHYHSARSALDWSTLSLDPPQRANHQHTKFQQVFAVSEDQSRAFVYSSMALAPGAEEGGGNIYVRDLDTNTYHLVASGYQLLSEYAESNAPGWLRIEGSPDFSRVVFTTSAKLDPGLPPIENAAKPAYTYEWSLEDGVKPATYYPNGALSPGKRPYNLVTKMKTYYAGGSTPPRIIYKDNYLDNEAPGIYLREGDEVTQITASQRSGDDPEDLQLGALMGTAEDLSVIYFSSKANLTDASHHDFGVANNGPAIYRYDVASGVLTDLTADFGPSQEDMEKLDGLTAYKVGQATPNGDAIYLASSAALAPGPLDKGNPRIYRLTKNAIELVSSDKVHTFFDLRFRETGDISPNGRYLVWASSGDETEDVSSGPTCEEGECQQIYIYDSVEKSVACASCDPTGAPSRGPSDLSALNELRNAVRNVTNQGMVAFQTPNALDSGDVNEALDVYTWQNGEINLISRGRGEPAFLNDMSEDGSTIAFTSRQRLVGRDTDNLRDVFVARIGGGLAAQNAAVVTPPCEGAECKGPATSSPADAPPVTPNFSGPGNAKAKPKPKARCGKGSKRVADKRKQRCVKKKGNKGKQRGAGAKRGTAR